MLLRPRTTDAIARRYATWPVLKHRSILAAEASVVAFFASLRQGLNEMRVGRTNNCNRHQIEHGNTNSKSARLLTSTLDVPACRRRPGNTRSCDFSHLTAVTCCTASSLLVRHSSG